VGISEDMLLLPYATDEVHHDEPLFLLCVMLCFGILLLGCLYGSSSHVLTATHHSYGTLA